MAKTLYMETTKISAANTVADIQKFLVASGAKSILIEYDEKTKHPSAIKFKLIVNNQEMHFALPARSEPIFNYISKNRSPLNRNKKQFIDKDKQQAERTAWRQILRWVEAQFALIHTGMVATEEVFMPYVITNTGQTLFEAFKEHKLNLLTEGIEE